MNIFAFLRTCYTCRFIVGDFVLLGYIYEHRNVGIRTLDVLEHEKSYFYVKDKRKMETSVTIEQI